MGVSSFLLYPTHPPTFMWHYDMDEKMYFEIYHKINPLHIYCRLMERGVELKTAKLVTRIYERTIFRVAHWWLRNWFWRRLK